MWWMQYEYSPETTVIGPLGSEILCLVKCCTKDFISVVLPTPGGPTTATKIGGGSSGVRSTSGTWCFLTSKSRLRRILRAALTALLGVKALGFKSLFSLEVPFRFFCWVFFFSAFRPVLFLRCALCGGASIVLFKVSEKIWRPTNIRWQSVSVTAQWPNRVSVTFRRLTVATRMGVCVCVVQGCDVISDRKMCAKHRKQKKTEGWGCTKGGDKT